MAEEFIIHCCSIVSRTNNSTTEIELATRARLFEEFLYVITLQLSSMLYANIPMLPIVRLSAEQHQLESCQQSYP